MMGADNKRHRFREARLWRTDPPSYYAGTADAPLRLLAYDGRAPYVSGLFRETEVYIHIHIYVYIYIGLNPAARNHTLDLPCPDWLWVDVAGETAATRPLECDFSRTGVRLYGLSPGCTRASVKSWGFQPPAKPASLRDAGFAAPVSVCWDRLFLAACVAFEDFD